MHVTRWMHGVVMILTFFFETVRMLCRVASILRISWNKNWHIYGSWRCKRRNLNARRWISEASICCRKLDRALVVFSRLVKYAIACFSTALRRFASAFCMLRWAIRWFSSRAKLHLPLTVIRVANYADVDQKNPKLKFASKYEESDVACHRTGYLVNSKNFGFGEFSSAFETPQWKISSIQICISSLNSVF